MQGNCQLLSIVNCQKKLVSKQPSLVTIPIVVHSRKMHSGSKISLLFSFLKIFCQEIKRNPNEMIIVVKIIGIIILEKEDHLDWFQEIVLFSGMMLSTRIFYAQKNSPESSFMMKHCQEYVFILHTSG